jgi:NADPH:quinone reductase-like Zn-dependent oxidoreductase
MSSSVTGWGAVASNRCCSIGQSSGVLEIVDLPDPHPGPGQVRIAVRAAGVNPSDWKKRKGLMDGQLPQTMGHEAAGVVDELGEGVADVASVIACSRRPQGCSSASVPTVHALAA